MLTASLDPAQTLERIAELAVPRFADWAVVDRFAPDDRVERVAVRHVDPEKVAIAHDAFRRFGPSKAEVAALRLAGPALVPAIPDAYLVATAKSEEHLALSRQLGFESLILVPLRGHTEVHGCLTFVTTRESGRTYGQADLAVAVDLARRAGAAYDNALLHREVALARERYRLATEAVHGLVYDHDLQSGTVVHSGGLLRLIGVPAEEGPRPAAWWRARVHPDDLARLDDAERSGASPLEASYRVRHADGSWRWVADSAVFVRDASGNAVRRVGCTVDVTDAVAAREALEAADRRKDQFLATLGHELRNPLAAVRAAVAVLGSDPAGPAASRAREVLVRQVGHMGRMLDDLLDVSRIQTGKLALHEAPVDLARVVADTVADLTAPAASAGVTLRGSAEAPVPVRGDATRLGQIVTNLIDNAVKASPPGGCVDVRVAISGGEATLEVTDEGPGVPPALRERLFEPFVQGEAPDRRHAGLGLGLALVAGLVALHRGRVEVGASRAGGARFVVRMPLDAPSADTARPGDNGGRVGRRVLLVEDNEDNAEMTRLLLELWGHRVEVVGDGPSALAAAERFQPEVVLCDVGLPGAMDGHAVARALRAAMGPEPFLVALTGFGQERDRQLAADAGFDRHLTKPVDPASLERLVGGGRDGDPRGSAGGG